MKKFYGAFCALLLGLLCVFAGCKADGEKVLEYLKTQKEFVGNPRSSESYRVDLSIGEDLSYSLSIMFGEGALKSYAVEGTQTEYMGCEESEYSSEWLGVSQNNTAYYHVVKLSDATVELNGKENAFYLIAHATSKRSDTFSLSLVAADSSYGADNLSSVLNGNPKFTLRKK